MAVGSLLMCVSAGALAAQSPAATPRLAQLASADTAITIEAGEQAPRLIQLRSPGGTAWVNQTAEPPPAQVTLNAVVQPLLWRLDPLACRFEPNRIALVYRSDAPHLQLTWDWRKRSEQGPLEHRMLIRNLSGQSLLLPLQRSFTFEWLIDPAQALERFWVEKGADAPSSEGAHRDALREGDQWFGVSSTYARPLPQQPREMIPSLLGGDGWYLGIEFSGRTQITAQRSGAVVRGEAGLNPEPGPYQTRLLANGVYETPSIFLGAVRGAADDAGNILRRWVRAVLGNPNTWHQATNPALVDNTAWRSMRRLPNA